MEVLKANELKIGNLISIAHESNNPFFGIKTFYENGVHVGGGKCYGFDLLLPIPLTEEWLIECGFEIINHIGGYSFYSLKRKRNENKPSIHIYKGHTTIGNNSMVKHCVYIHQLQNLYFVLTGEELRINPKPKNKLRL